MCKITADMQSKEKPFGKKELEFAIFCVESVASKLGIDGSQAYLMLTETTGILNQYVIPQYEVLHTQGKDYIVDDILGVLKERGVNL